MTPLSDLEILFFIVSQTLFIMFIILTIYIVPEDEIDFFPKARLNRFIMSLILKHLDLPDMEPEKFFSCFDDLERQKASYEKKQKELLKLKNTLHQMEKEKEGLATRLSKQNRKKSRFTSLTEENDSLQEKVYNGDRKLELLKEKRRLLDLKSTEVLEKHSDFIKKMKTENQNLRCQLDTVNSKHEKSYLN